jgi:DNA-binding transcriptional MerR regulator
VAYVSEGTLRIGDVASKAGVSARALRYYEEQRLLTPERSASGQRVYGEAAVERVRLIQQLYAAGLSSRTVRTVLPCVDTGHATPEIVDVLVAERERISIGIADLKQAQAQLDRIILHTRGSSIDNCQPHRTEPLDAPEAE